MTSLLLLLIIKHFIADFLLQTPYQYKNKGTYGHMGGILHAGIHTSMTYLCFALLSLPFTWLALVIPLVEGIVHYHIDWLKVYHGNRTSWADYRLETIAEKAHLSIYSDKYFWSLGFDQLLHQLCYLAIVVILF